MRACRGRLRRRLVEMLSLRTAADGKGIQTIGVRPSNGWPAGSSRGAKPHEAIVPAGQPPPHLPAVAGVLTIPASIVYFATLSPT